MSWEHTSLSEQKTLVVHGAFVAHQGWLMLLHGTWCAKLPRDQQYHQYNEDENWNVSKLKDGDTYNDFNCCIFPWIWGQPIHRYYLQHKDVQTQDDIKDLQSRYDAEEARENGIWQENCWFCRRGWLWVWKTDTGGCWFYSPAWLELQCQQGGCFHGNRSSQYLERARRSRR